MAKLAKHMQKNGGQNSKKKFKKQKLGPNKGQKNHAEEKRKKQNRDDSEDDNDMNMDFDDNEFQDTVFNFSSATSYLSSEWGDDHEDDEDYPQETLEEIVASKGLTKPDEKEIHENAVKKEDIPFQELDCLTDMVREKLNKFTEIPVTKRERNALQSILKGINVNTVVENTEGKRLALSVAALELVIKRSMTDSTGVAVVIIVRNYEAAKSIEGFLNEISQDLELSIGLLVEGKSAKSEAKDLSLIKKGLDIVIATPQRLLHHLNKLSGFRFKGLSSLIIDEADFFFKNDLKDQLFEICRLSSGRSQTVVLSRRRTKETESLVEIGEQKSPVSSLPHDQAYLLCPVKRKFQVLHAILETNRRKKVIVFMRTSSQVEFFCSLLFKLDLAVLHLNESMTKEEKIKYMKMFKSACAGIMLATDKSLADNEFRRVSVVIHFDVPTDFRQYMKRVNKLSESKQNTTSLMLLTKDEKNILEMLRKHNMQLQSISSDLLSLDNIQPEIVKTLRCTPHLRSLGVKAVKHYLTSYINKLPELDLEEICFNFGFIVNSGRIDDTKLFRHIKEYLEKAEKGNLTEGDEEPVNLDHFDDDESDDSEDDDVVGVIGYYKGPALKKRKKQTMTYHEWNEEQKEEVESPVGAVRGAKGSGAGRGRGRGGSGRHADRWIRSFDKGQKQSDAEENGDEEKGNPKRKRKQLSKKVKKRINSEKRLKRLGINKERQDRRSGFEKQEERRNFASTRGRPERPGRLGRPGLNRRGNKRKKQ